MHAKGLKLAIYEDIGTKTCAGYPGSWTRVATDAQTFADWKVDYLKLDGCNLNTTDQMQEGSVAHWHWHGRNGKIAKCEF
jgi:hypothetical protein